MTRLLPKPWILWLLMICIGAQGMGSAAHRIGHGWHNAERSERVARTLIASDLAAPSSPIFGTPAEFGRLVVPIDEGNPQNTELCLVCANLAAAKHLNTAPFWLAHTAFKAIHPKADLRRIPACERLLFALARAPPSDLS